MALGSTSSATAARPRREVIAVAGAYNTTYIVIRTSAGLRPPGSLKPMIAKRGTKRVPKRNLRRIPGEIVRFVEMGSRGAHVITMTKKARGSIYFRPAKRLGRMRQIVATIEQDGLPRASMDLVTFRAGS